MIKVISSFICSFTAFILLILCLVTNYWLEWEITNAWYDTHVTHYRGLWEHCFEIDRRNDSWPFPANKTVTECSKIDEGAFVGVVVAFIIIAILVHVIAFIFALIYACNSSSKRFPVKICAGLFFVAALVIMIALLVYTEHYHRKDVFFSWSYGGGWSVVALDFIAFVLIIADR